MKMRLLTTIIAATALGGCATYDYAGGSAPGGYYHGRPSVEYYDPYGGIYGGYNYGYHYGHGYRDPYGYYGGYYPYYPYYPYHPRPPRPRPPTNPEPPPDRAPASRDPVDGRYRETGRVRIPSHNRSPVPATSGMTQSPSPLAPMIRNPGVRQRVNDGVPRQQVPQPVAPRTVERPRPVERAERAAPERRSENRDRVRTREP